MSEIFNIDCIEVAVMKTNVDEVKNTIIQGDSLDVLKTFPDDCISCVVTSPPYWSKRDYGIEGQLGLEPTFSEYIKKLCDIFDEVKRVLRKDGCCFVNLGDTYAGSLCGFGAKRDSKIGFQKAPVNAGFYGSSKQKPLSAKVIYHEIKRYKGRGKTKEVPAKSLCLIPSRFAIEMVNRGWILRNTIIWHKPNCMPESVIDRFTNDFEYIFFFVKSRKYYFEQQFEPLRESTIERVKHNVFSQKTDTGIVGEMDLEGQRKAFEKMLNPNCRGANKRTVWFISTASDFSGNHFAMFPEKLVIPMVLAGCPESGIVMDIFMGAGTVGVVAKRLNRNFIGIELNPDYVKMSQDRISKEPVNLL